MPSNILGANKHNFIDKNQENNNNNILLKKLEEKIKI